MRHLFYNGSQKQKAKEMSHRHIRVSTAKIQETFALQKQLAEGIRMMATAMCEVGTVNLSALAKVAQAKEGVQAASTEKRFSRLLSVVELDMITLASFIIALAGIKIDKRNKRILILDRTYWTYGKTHINILYLAIIHDGVAIPIFFKLLGEDTESGKKGNSSIEERQIVLDAYIKVFGLESISILIGDREFMGQDWIDSLKFQQIPYIMRIKTSGIKIQTCEGQWQMLDEYCQQFPYDKVHDLGHRTLGATKPFTSNIMLYIKTTTPEDAERQSKESRGAKNSKNKANKKAVKSGNVTALEPEVIALCYSTGLQDACALYRKRWAIETLFFTLKSGGFNIEHTHVTDPKRLILLMQITMMAAALCYRVGIMSHAIRPILIKKHGYKEESFISRGMDDVKKFLGHYARYQKTTISLNRVLTLVQPKRQINRTKPSYKPPIFSRIDTAA